MKHWLHSLAALHSGVLVTVLKTAGSAPRDCGAQMLVGVDQSVGTIGGGRLEFEAIAIARRLMVGEQRACIQRWVLGASLGQCCGGAVEVLFEPVSSAAEWYSRAMQKLQSNEAGWLLRTFNTERVSQPQLVDSTNVDELSQAHSVELPQQGAVVHYRQLQDGCLVESLSDNWPELWVYGAGHVGRALVKQLALLPCRVVWVDERENQFPVSSASTVSVVCADPITELPVRPADCIVLTHSHTLDFELCRLLLARSNVGYVGLIGSDTKAARFRKRLQQRSVDIGRLHSPIGLNDIDSKEPALIALSIAAQLACRWTQALVHPQAGNHPVL